MSAAACANWASAIAMSRPGWRPCGRSARIKPAVIQNRFYAKTGYDRELRAFCRDHGILYQSFWTLTANPEILAKPELVALAEQYGRSPAQLFFRFLTQRDILCLTGTSSEASYARGSGDLRFSPERGGMRGPGRAAGRRAGLRRSPETAPLHSRARPMIMRPARSRGRARRTASGPMHFHGEDARTGRSELLAGSRR